MKICAYRDCEQNFVPARHNQKYCDSQCCKDEMSARARDAYAKKRARLNGSSRHCDSCGSALSKYNDGTTCSLCKASEKKREREDLMRSIGG